MSDLKYCIEKIDHCKNKRNISGSCWEFCAYRENGCCELDKEKIIYELLSELLGQKIERKEGLFFDLVEFYKKQK